MIGVTSTVLIFILLKYGSKAIHYVWAWFNFVCGLWGFSAFFIGLAKTETIAMIWWKIGLFGAILTPIVFYHVIVVLGELKRFKVVLLFYTFAFSFYLLTIVNVLHTKIILVCDSLYYIRGAGLAYGVFVGIWMIITVYAVSELYKLFRISAGEKRLQFKYLLFGFAIGFGGALVDALTMIGIDVDIFPMGNVPIWAYCVISTYAILRHKLLDVEVIIRKTLVFTGLLASVFVMVILPTLLIQDYILRSASFGTKIAGLVISSLLIILTMRRIESFLINITDKYLFQKKYDYKELLRTFTGEVLTVLELDKLVNLTVDKLIDIIKLNSATVLLFDDEKQQFEVAASRNIKDPEVKLIRPDGIVTFMEETHGYLLVKELHAKKIFVPASIQDIIDKLSAELIIPMVTHTELIGVLSLGKKKSDEEYSQDDLDILLPLAKTLAIAISNAELFIELGKTQAEAAQSEKMAVIGTLSAGINHEICNPLGIARGQCEAFLLNLKDGLYKAKTTDELLAKAKDIMTKVIHEVDRATVITKKLSQFAKPAKGDSEAVNIDKEIEDVLGLVGYELKLEKIEISKHISTTLPDIFVDRKQFQEVLFNLLRNAGQAIGEKGKITITAREDRGKVSIDIQDSGSGISEEKIKQLFNPFFTTKYPGKGTGLGLFIVRQVVEKNGGRIYLKETKVGGGTTFTLEFPAAINQESKIKK
jgi:signal transduction histidine kinase